MKNNQSINHASHDHYKIYGAVFVAVMFFLFIASFFDGTITGFAVYNYTSESDFGQGTLQNVSFSSGSIQLTSSHGAYISNIIDAGMPAEWKSLSLAVNNPTCSASLSFQNDDIYSGTKDTYIKSNSPDANYKSGDLQADMDSSSIKKPVIKFEDIFGTESSQILLSSSITAANMTLMVSDKGDSIEVYEVLEDWSEDEATWNNRDASNIWRVEGAGYTDESAKSHSSVLLDSFSPSSTGFYTFSVLSAIENWKTSNNGIVLNPTDENNVKFRSSEYGTQSNRPKLEVSYSYDCTEVKYQVRSCSDSECSSEFTGPDGSDSYYTSSFSLDVSDARYFQYKVFMSTNNTNFFPSVSDIVVENEIQNNLNITLSSSSSSSYLGQTQLFSASSLYNNVNVSSNISWSSNIDSSLGTGSSVNVSLSVGTHTINASIRTATAFESTTFSHTVENSSKPLASVFNETYTSSVAPSSVLIVSASLNAQQETKTLTASLNVPSGFEFVETSSYPITQSFGNKIGIATGKWILASPSSSGIYNLTVTWSDKYNNTWTSDIMTINVSSSSSTPSQNISTTFVSLSSLVEISSGNEFKTEAYVKDISGNLVSADSVKFTIFDSLGGINTGPVDYTTNPSTGKYIYTKNISSDINGDWAVIVNVSRNNKTFSEKNFFKLSSGGPFDLRNISILNSEAENLHITSVLENKGTKTADIIVRWNLTKENILLDEGQDTVGVFGGEEKSHSITPHTNETGNVKISLTGYFGNDFIKKVAAFELFTITGAATSGQIVAATITETTVSEPEPAPAEESVPEPAPESVEESVLIGSISPGEEKSTSFDDKSVNEIKINVKQAAENVEIKVKSTSLPSDIVAPGSSSVVEYLDISTNIEDDKIDNATIRFKVSKEWLINNEYNANAVVLQRYKNGEWQKLYTSMVSENENEYMFQAMTPGFSTFAITAFSFDSTLTEFVEEDNTMIIAIVLVLIVIVAAVFYMKFYTKKKKRRK